MSLIDQKTKMPLGLVLTLIGIIASVASTAGISHYRLSQLQKEWQENRVEISRRSEQFQAQELKVQRLDLTLNNIEKKLDSIDKKIDRMERK